MKAPNREDHQIVSYLFLRMLIGACGIVLPLACLIYGSLTAMEDSISDYYATGIRDVFVGILFVLGFFLFTYKGYDKRDDLIANAGFFFALGVAMFPCNSDHAWVRATHFVSAFLLFSVFIFFSLRLFTLSVKEGVSSKKEDTNTKIYIACGWVMVVSIVAIGLSFWLMSDTLLDSTNIVFWLESVALLAFAVSWMTKGRFYHETSMLLEKVKIKLTKHKDSTGDIDVNPKTQLE